MVENQLVATIENVRYFRESQSPCDYKGRTEDQPRYWLLLKPFSKTFHIKKNKFSLQTQTKKLKPENALRKMESVR